MNINTIINNLLTRIEQIKLNIKQSLVNKGVDMNNVSFSEYSTQIDNLKNVKNIVELTQEEYDALETIDPDTLYLIVYYTEGV